SFANGLVTTIEILDGVDLVLQTLFDSFNSSGSSGEGIVLVQEHNTESAGAEDEGLGSVPTGGLGTEGIFASDHIAVLPGNGVLTLAFGRPLPLAQVPEVLRNIVLELSLGNGTPPPAHGGESGGQSQVQGEGTGGAAPPSGEAPQGIEQPAAGLPAPFSVE